MPVPLVNRRGASTAWHKCVGHEAVVHRVAELRAFRLIDRNNAALRRQLLAVEARDRQTFVEESQEFCVIKTLWVFANTGTIANTDDDRVPSVITIQDAHHVARNVAVGAAGDLDRELLLARIDATSAQRDIEEDVHAFARHAVHLVIDTGAWLRTHERRRHRVAAHASAIDNPHDVRRRDVFIRPEIDEFVLAEAIDDGLLHIGNLHDEVEDRIDERLHTAVDRRARLEQNRGLCAAFRDVLVLELLRPREAVDLVEETLALARVLRGARRTNDAQTTARNVLETIVEAVETAAMHEERAVGLLGSIVVREVRRINAQAERKSLGEEVVRAQRRRDALKHLREHRAMHFARLARNVGFDLRATRGEIGIVHRLRRLETCDEQLHDGRCDRQRFLGETMNTLARPKEAVLRRKHLVGHVAETHDRFGFIDREFAVAARQFERLVVDPLDAPQIADDRLPQIALRVDRLAIGALHDESDEGDRATLAIAHDVEVRAMNRNRVAREDLGRALEHRARARVLDNDHDAAHRRM